MAGNDFGFVPAQTPSQAKQTLEVFDPPDDFGFKPKKPETISAPVVLTKDLGFIPKKAAPKDDGLGFTPKNAPPGFLKRNLDDLGQTMGDIQSRNSKELAGGVGDVKKAIATQSDADLIPGAMRAAGGAFGFVAAPISAAASKLEQGIGELVYRAGGGEKLEKGLSDKDKQEIHSAGKNTAQEEGEKYANLALMAAGGKGPREMVKSAAIKDGERVYTGKDHEQIRASMPEGSKKGADADTGFVTTKGRFIGREEADKMAKSGGQFKKEIKGKDKLHSEELRTPEEMAAGAPPAAPATKEPAYKSVIFSETPEPATTKPLASVQGLADRLYANRGNARADYKEAGKWASQFKGVPNETWEKFQAHDDNPKAVPLTPEEQMVYDRSVGVMKKEIEDLRTKLTKNGVNPNEYMEEGEQGDIGGAIRQRKGMNTPMDRLTGTKGKKPPGYPEQGRTLSKSAGTLKSRSMMSLNDANGRQTVHIDREGNIYDAAKRGDPIGVRDVETGEVRLKDPARKAQLGEATAAEIEKATGGQIEYHKNALGVNMTTLLQLRRADRSVSMLNGILKSPEMKEFVHSPFSKGKIPNGWREIPNSPEFRGYRFDPKFAEEIEDYLGSQRRDMGSLNKLDMLNRFMLNTMFWFNPVHIWNIADAFVVSKGAVGFTKDFAPMVGDLAKSVRSVATRDKVNMQQARAGVPMPGLDNAASDFTKMMQEAMNIKAQQDPVGFKNWMKQFAKDNSGISTPEEFFKYTGNLGHKITFSVQDVLQQTLERGYMRQGMTQAEATEEAAKVFTNYRTPARVMNQRWIGQALQGQAWVEFPKYEYGTLKGMYNILKGSAKLDKKSLDQALAIAMLYEFGKYVVNPLLQEASGNPKAEIGAFGYEKYPDLAEKLLAGKRTIPQAEQSMVVPGYIPQAIALGWEGVNPYFGRPTSLPGESPMEIGYDYADQFSRKFSPMQKLDEVTSGQRTPEEAFLEQMGVRFPGEIPRSVQRELKTKEKYYYPAGVQ